MINPAPVLPNDDNDPSDHDGPSDNNDEAQAQRRQMTTKWPSSPAYPNNGDGDNNSHHPSTSALTTMMDMSPTSHSPVPTSVSQEDDNILHAPSAPASPDDDGDGDPQLHHC